MIFSDPLFRLRALFRNRAMESALDEELHLHIERQILKHRQNGLTQQEAERLAGLEFGGVEQVKEQSRDARGVSLVEALIKDVRYGGRTLWKSPAFTTVAVLSLALGIGANAAIFQLLDAIRLRTLPVDAPRELAAVLAPDLSRARGSVAGDGNVTYRIWEQVRARQKAFSSMLAWSDAAFNLSPAGEVRMVPGLWVSGEFFRVLGVTPALGRVFTAADDVRGCGTPGTVISNGFWQSEFHRDPTVIGRSLRLNGHPVPVIGVTRAGFTGLQVGGQFEVAVPICSTSTLWFDAPAAGTFWWLNVIGRLRPGVSLEQAAAQMNSISPAVFEASLPANYPRVSVKDYLNTRLTAQPAATGFSGLRNQYSTPLAMLLAIAALVLLIACANLANLMLARSSAREREIAVRLAIGASRGRLVRQLMTESLLLAAAGASLALFLSGTISRALISLLTTGQDSVFLDLHPDWRVLAFTAALAILTCLLFGLAPALRATVNGPGALLKSAGRGLTAGRERFGLRRLLVASQIAFSLVLLVGALLFVRTLRNLAHAQTGFRQEGILIADLSFPRAHPAEVAGLQNNLLKRIQAVPGVVSAAGTTIVPLGGSVWDNQVWMDGQSAVKSSVSCLSRISRGYFRTLETPLLAGRDFEDQDAPGAGKVAIVNQAFARRIAQAPHPVGLSFHVEPTPSVPETVYRIIGVVADAKYRNLREDFEPVIYLPLSQNPDPSQDDQLLIRTSIPTSSVLPSLRRVISEVDPNAAFEFHELRERIDELLVPERLMATLSSAFGILAALLSQSAFTE